MSEETVVAAPSAVQESPVSYEIPRSGTPEYTEWRTSGKLPEKAQPKTADPAPADKSEQATTEDAADSAATTQEQEQKSKRRPDIEARFKQYADEVKALKAELESERRSKQTQADSSPAKPAQPQQPQTYQDWRKGFKPSEWVTKYAEQNPEASYEDAQAAMADHLADVRDQYRSYEQTARAQAKDLETKIADARSRYENFDEVSNPFVEKLVSSQNVPPVVKQMVNDSDVFADLVFTLAGDPNFLALAQNEPGKAIRYIAKVESLIEAKTGASDAGTRNEKGQFVAAKQPETPAPAKRGPESAPEPPIAIGSRGAGPMDESERAFKAIKSGDAKATRAWLDAEQKKLNASRRGF